MAVPSRLRWTINSPPRYSLMRASWTRSATFPSANSSKAREKVDSEGSFLHLGKPQMRRSARSTVRRSIKSTVASSPSKDLATKAFASQARSCGWRPTPHHPVSVNSSIRNHSRTWITFLSFVVSVPTTCLRSGKISY